MHHVVFPFAIIVAVVFVGEFAFSLETVLVELAEVGCAVGPLELAVDFVALEKFASKYCAILPVLFSLTVLVIVFP